MSKPVVYFIGEPLFSSATFPGYEVAYVNAIKHPKLGSQKVRTSIILEHFDDGFETMNTIYKRYKDGDSAE